MKTTNLRERLEAFWSGQRPDEIPYTIYENEWKGVKDRPEWKAMFDDGLGVTVHAHSVEESVTGLETRRDEVTSSGQAFERHAMITPVGEITSLVQADWTQKYWLTNSDDYRVMTWIVRHKEVRPAYDEFNALQRQMPPYMIPLVYAGRTPLQSILVDYCGLENFAFHLFDFADEIRELYEALLEKFRQKIEMIAQGPGRYVAVLENFTSETLGPDRFAEFHMPVYKATYPLLQSAGKVVGNHYDGKIGVCKKMIADSPIDLIESLTEPPEGDLTLAQARAALPDKLLWANINVSSYQLPPEELEGLVHRLVEEGSVKGRRLALEVSEHLPANWAQSMPVVLRALKQRRP